MRRGPPQAVVGVLRPLGVAAKTSPERPFARARRNGAAGAPGRRGGVEHAVDDDAAKLQAGIEAGAEAVNEGHRAAGLEPGLCARRHGAPARSNRRRAIPRTPQPSLSPGMAVGWCPSWSTRISRNRCRCMPYICPPGAGRRRSTRCQFLVEKFASVPWRMPHLVGKSTVRRGARKPLRVRCPPQVTLVLAFCFSSRRILVDFRPRLPNGRHLGGRPISSSARGRRSEAEVRTIA